MEIVAHRENETYLLEDKKKRYIIEPFRGRRIVTDLTVRSIVRRGYWEPFDGRESKEKKKALIEYAKGEQNG